VIDEIMIDPKTLSDAQGEWFELANISDTPFDLQGCVLDDGNKDTHPIAASLVVKPGEFATIARSEQVSFAASYVTSLSFTNSADTIALRCAEIEIDRVSYDKARGFPVVSGASLSLDPARLSADANDAADAWCPATQSYGPELGSPGAANPPCHSGRSDLDAGVDDP
jgi:hypothetical protein